jgi:hypothetical protein
MEHFVRSDVPVILWDNDFIPDLDVVNDELDDRILVHQGAGSLGKYPVDIQVEFLCVLCSLEVIVESIELYKRA